MKAVAEAESSHRSFFVLIIGVDHNHIVKKVVQPIIGMFVQIGMEHLYPLVVMVGKIARIFHQRTGYNMLYRLMRDVAIDWRRILSLVSRRVASYIDNHSVRMPFGQKLNKFETN